MDALKSFSIRCLGYACLLLFLLSFGCDNSPPKSRMEKRVSLHLNNMEASALQLEEQMNRLADAKVVNTVDRMRSVMAIVEDAETALAQANQDVRDYLVFIAKNKRALEAEKLTSYIVIKEILGHNLKNKRQAAAAYFTHMKRWMAYSAENYSKIKSRHAQAYKSYEALLINVNRSLKAYNTANDQYHRHTDAFLSRYPALKQKFKRQYKTMKEEMGWL